MTSSPLMPQTGGFDQRDAAEDHRYDAVNDMAEEAIGQTDLDLIAVLGSRLCHDLISPMGAIGNGVELMAMSGGPMSPELQLIAQSVNAANARLKFFRVAFGQASPDQRLGAPEIRNLLRDMAQTGRLTYDWRAEGDHARRVVKLCFLSLLCLETALPWGGAVSLYEESGHWAITAQTKKTKQDPAIWATLSGDPTQVSPAQIQFALLTREAANYGARLNWSVGEAEAEIGFDMA